MKKLLFVNVGGAITDRRTWSGILFSLYNEFNKYYSVDTYVVSGKRTFFDKIYIFYHRIIKREICRWYYTSRYAKRASKDLQKKLETQKYDVIFVVGPTCISYLKTNIPIVYFSDAVLSCLLDYYWFGFKNEEIKAYSETQKKALANADSIILTSHWAEKAAVDDYGISKDKIHVHYFGANIEVEKIEHIKHEGFNLLFVGVDLNRKGISVALEAVNICNKIDPTHHYTLNVVGGKPECDVNPEEVIVHGFINRNNDAEREILDHLRAISDVFILPTRAECAGIVFCEAAAYGIPSLSYATGGVPDYIKDGETGFLFDMKCNAHDFANKIVYLANNKNVLETMQKNARAFYESDLNWEKLGSSIHEEICREFEKRREKSKY